MRPIPPLFRAITARERLSRYLTPDFMVGAVCALAYVAALVLS